MATYPLAPWLTPSTDTATEYSRGIQTGAQIAQERNRMQMQAEQAAMNAAIRQQEAERDSIRQQQKILMEKAYQDAQIGLRKQQLEQQAAVTELRTQQAARRFAAQRSYQQRVMAGEDPAKVMLEIGPSMTDNISGFGSLYKAAQPTPDFEPITRTVGKADLVEIAPHRWQQIVRSKQEVPGQLTQKERAQIAELRDERKLLAKQIGNPALAEFMPPEQYKGATNRLAQINREIKDIVQEPETQKGLAPNEIIRLGKDGRRVVFDKNTKQALRYAD